MLVEEEWEMFKECYQAAAELDDGRDVTNHKLRLSREMMNLAAGQLEDLRGDLQALRSKDERLDHFKMILLQDRRRRGASGSERGTEKSAAQASFLRRMMWFIVPQTKLDLRLPVALQRLNPGRSLSEYEPFDLAPERPSVLYQRERAGRKVLQHWHERFLLSEGKTKASGPPLTLSQRGSRDEIVNISGTRGMGSSRVLAMLAGKSKDPGPRSLPKHMLSRLTDEEVKHDILEKFCSIEGTAALGFTEVLRESVSVCVTFGRGMSRERDRHELPSAEDALVSRILFSYFGNRKAGYRDFVQAIDRTSLPSLERAISLVRDDINNQRLEKGEAAGSRPATILLFIDEVLAGVQGQQDDLHAIVAALGELLDRDPYVHVVIACASNLQLVEAAEASERRAVNIPLPPLRPNQVQEMIQDYHKHKSWQMQRWAHDPVCMEAVEGCAGDPGLLVRIFPLLESGKRSFGDLSFSLCSDPNVLGRLETISKMFDPSHENSGLALLYALRGNARYARESLEGRLESVDALRREGFLGGTPDEPEVPPLSWLMWRSHPKWESVDPLTRRLVELGERVIGTSGDRQASRPRPVFAPDLVGEDETDAFSARFKARTFTSPNVHFANRVLSILQLRALVLGINPARPFTHQCAEGTSAEVTLDTFLPRLRKADKEHPVYSSVVVLPGEFVVESVESFGAGFEPVPGRLYIRRQSPDQCVGGFNLLLALQSKAPPSSDLEAAAPAGRASAPGPGKPRARPVVPPIVLVALDFNVYQSPTALAQSVLTSVEMSDSLHRFALRGRLAYVHVPPGLGRSMAPPKILNQVRLARDSPTHPLRAIPELREAALWQLRWDLTESIVRQLASLSTGSLRGFVGRSLLLEDRALDSDSLLRAPACEIWALDQDSNAPKGRDSQRRG